MTRYKQIYISGGKRKYVHRHVMELDIGRSLLTTECVHHINGDPTDNRLENLQMMSFADHQRLHNSKYPTTRSCEICDVVFAPHPKRLGRDRTCSKTCGQALRWRNRKAAPNYVPPSGPVGPRLTHCKHGHEFNEQNTYWRITSTGNRNQQCRTCKRLRMRRTK